MTLFQKKLGQNGSLIRQHLFNEKRLNMMDENARKYLSEQRNRFFNGEDVDQAEGFVAPNE